MTAHAPFPPSAPRPARPDDADEREFEAFARTQDGAELQAALWATRRQEGLDAAAEARFQHWLAADPAHGAAYAGLAQGLDRLRQMPRDRLQSLRQGLARDLAAAAEKPEKPEKPASRPRASSPARRSWLLDMLPRAATAAAVAGMAGGGWLGWQHWREQPVLRRQYSTARGQRLNVELPDGSTLQLDAATRAEATLYRHRREVRLLDGQAMFAVSRDAARPFEVLAGATRITVVGTRFSVRHTQAGMDAGKTVVAVESGRVRVAPAPGQDTSPVELAAGQGVSADGLGRIEGIVTLQPEGVGAWRKGRVSFNDTPLEQALAEFERYGDTGLVVHDPAVAALRLGGSFELRQVGAFAQALPYLLPVRLVRRGAVTEIVGAR